MATKKLTEKRPGGRPSKFKEKHMPKIKKMAEAGFTDVEMAEMLGVTDRTFNNWKKKYPSFFQSLKDWKMVADEKVERSLYERACGYEHEEDKIFNNNGQEMVVETIKHYPPDTTAAIFWLKNRQPEKWRDKQELEHSGTITNEVTIIDDIKD